MPKITQLPFITTGTTATSFLMVDERATRRMRYDDLLDRVVDDLGGQVFYGPTGPAGPVGPTGPSGGGPTGPSGADGVGIPAGGSTGQVLSKSSNLNYDVVWSTVSGGGGGVGLGSRIISTSSSAVLASNTTATFTATGFKSYLLQKIRTNVPAWVRIYSDNTNATSDVSNRHEGYDPLPGAGVIAEVITTAGNLTQLITPGVIGFNDDAVPADVVYLAATNRSGTASTVTVTLTLLQLES